MPRTIKTVLELGGEANYKKGLQSIDRALKAMSGEVSDATAKFAENSNSLENITNLSNAYKNQIEQQKVKVESLKSAVERSNTAYETAVQKYKDAAAANGENSKETLKAALELDKAEKALDGYKASLVSAEKYLESSTKKMEEFASKNKNIAALGNSIDKIKEKIKSLSAVRNVTSLFDKLKGKASEIASKLEPVTSKLKKIKTGVDAVKGIFELAAKKAAAIKQKLEPAINVCKSVAKAAAQITFKSAEMGAKAVTSSIKTTAKAFAAYSTAVSGAATATFATIESTREYRSDLAKLEQGAATSGNSFSAMKDQLTNLTALTGESDSSIEALSNLMSAGFSDSQITSAVDALSGAVVKFPDTLKIESLSDSLQETIATGAGTGQFAELIERSGDSLDDFNAGLEACGSEAERQEYALNYLAESGLAKVNEEYTKSHKALLDYEKAEQAVTDANSKLAESAMPIAASFKNGYAGIISAFANVINGTNQNGAALTQKINEFATNIATNVTQYAPQFILAVNTVILAIISNLPTLLQAILPPLLTGFNTLISGLISMIPTMLPILLSGFTSLFGSMITAVNQIGAQLMPMLPVIVTQIGTTLLENLPVLLNGALQMFQGLLQALTQVSDLLMPMLPELITNLCDTLIANLPAIISTGFDLLVSLIEGITNAIPALMEKVPEIIDGLVGGFTDNIDKLVKAGFELIKSLATGLPRAIPNILVAIPEIITSIVSAFMENDWLQLGIDIIKGLGNGLIDGVNVIWEKIKEMANNLLDSIKSALGIHSPSKLFRDEVGTYLAQGVGVGFSDEMKNVTKDMQKAVPSDFDTVVNADINSFGSRKTGSVVNNKNQNTNVYFHIEKVVVDSDENIEESVYKLEAMCRRAKIALGGV